jgi:hypothetical protein
MTLTEYAGSRTCKNATLQDPDPMLHAAFCNWFGLVLRVRAECLHAGSAALDFV